MSNPGRSVWKVVWNNFLKSFQPRKNQGDLVGMDNFGNKYFEIAADPSAGKRKPTRWFEPTISDKYDQELSAEWEAWLRGRRNNPPTPGEIAQNLAVSNLKKINAAELEQKHHPGAVPNPEKVQGFPKFDEYEVMPGTHQDKEKK